MSEDVSNEGNDMNENKEQNEEEENNATAAFANNVGTNITNKSNKRVFEELTFSKGEDFIVESSPKNHILNKDETLNQPKQKLVTFDNTANIKHQTLKSTNPNYNAISNIMNDQLLISKSVLFTKLRETTTVTPTTTPIPNTKEVPVSNTNEVNALVDNNNNTTLSNNTLIKTKRNSMNSGFGEMWIPPPSFQNSVNNYNSNSSNMNVNANVNENIQNVISQETKTQTKPKELDININKSLQMINKDLDILTGNINESISGGRFYNKRNNYGCSCYDASILIHNPTINKDHYNKSSQNTIANQYHFPKPISASQRYSEYYSSSTTTKTNPHITSFKTKSKANSRVLYNVQSSSQTNIFI